jgi:hypothetical protein
MAFDAAQSMLARSRGMAVEKANKASLPTPGSSIAEKSATDHAKKSELKPSRWRSPRSLPPNVPL